MAYSTQTIKRLYLENDDAEEGTCLEICPSPDNSDSILLHTPTFKWFGNIEIHMNANECKELGKALIDYAEKFEQDNA